MLYRNFSPLRFLSVSHTNIKQFNTVAWSNKLFVNYLKLPKLFGPTGEDVTKDIDLTGKTCLITGGTSGIGVEMVRCLTAKNCDVIMACRNPYAAQFISKNVWGDSAKIKTYETNLASLNSVKKSTDEMLKKQKKIDIVILNAAVFGIPWTLTEDGFETLFQVNYLSQFYMIMNLQKLLASDARVVFMSSDSHRNLKWRLEDTISPTRELISLPRDEYTSIKAYNITKVCQILAMHYLSYLWTNTGKSVFCAHPGTFIKIKLCSNWWPYELMYTAMTPFSKSVAQAAATPLFCATSPDLNSLSDLYIKNCKEYEVSALAHDTHLAFRIIDLSKSLLMETIGFGKDIIQEVERTEVKKQPEEIKPEPTKSIIEEPVLST